MCVSNFTILRSLRKLTNQKKTKKKKPKDKKINKQNKPINKTSSVLTKFFTRVWYTHHTIVLKEKLIFKVSSATDFLRQSTYNLKRFVPILNQPFYFFCPAKNSRLYWLQRSKPPPPKKRGILDMTLNCIWWWGSSSGLYRLTSSLQLLPGSLWSVVSTTTVRIPTMGLNRSVNK